MTTTELSRLGIGPAVLRSLQRDGIITRVTRGVYVETARLDPDVSEVARRGRGKVAADQHLLRLDAILRGYGTTVGASHQSAALAWGLPVLMSQLGRVHVARTTPGGTGRKHDGFTVHRCEQLGAFTVHDGRRLVVPPLAVIGTSAICGLNAGLVTADGALHARRTTPDELREWLTTLKHHPGLSTARAVVDLADGTAESAGESLLRLILVRLGIAFEAQHWVRVADGAFYRVDFYLPELGVVLEFDGLTKYGSSGATDAQDAGRARPKKDPLVAEKLREDAVRAEGFGVGRVIWSGLNAVAVRSVITAAAAQAGEHAKHHVATPPPWTTSPQGEDDR